MKDKIEKDLSFKKTKNQAKANEPFKLGLKSQTHNPWNLRLGLNKEAQFPTN